MITLKSVRVIMPTGFSVPFYKGCAGIHEYQITGFVIRPLVPWQPQRNSKRVYPVPKMQTKKRILRSMLKNDRRKQHG